VKVPPESKELLGFLKHEVREDGASLLRKFVATYEMNLGKETEGLGSEKREKLTQEELKKKRDQNKEERERKRQERKES